MSHHLAQANIAHLAAPLDSIGLRDFVSALEPVNAVADDASGFIWRLQVDDESPTEVVAFGDSEHDAAGVVVNMSIWIDMSSLRDFIYGSAHLAVLRRRREWFLPITTAYSVCWWVPQGHRPTVCEAADRLAQLRTNGPTHAAFTLRNHFPPPTVESLSMCEPSATQ